MKKLSFFLLIILIIAGCASSKKFLQKGRYDMAINKAVQKIRKKPDSRKDIEVLEKAFPLANNIDLDRIKFLKAEGQPDVWDEVFELYSALKRRQDLVKTVCPIKLPERTINFSFRDYDKDIITAKKKAAEYFYFHGKSLLDKGDKYSAREAYSDFQKVRSYYRTYEDVDKYIEKARIMGMSYALVQVVNNSIFKLPVDFKDNLINLNYMKINHDWVEYDNKKRTGINYDYNINVNLKIIDVMPEAVKEEHLTESKEVDDGFEYVLDDNGNVMKDSLGNDIKIPKTKTITCQVIKTYQHKAVHIEGTVDFYDNVAGKIIKSHPIATDFFFDNVYAIANGNLSALSESSSKLLNNKPMPFPSDFDMIYGAGDILKKNIEDALRYNKQIIN